MGKTYHYEEDTPPRDKEALKQARRDRIKSRRIQPDQRSEKVSEKDDKNERRNSTWDD